MLVLVLTLMVGLLLFTFSLTSVTDDWCDRGSHLPRVTTQYPPSHATPSSRTHSKTISHTVYISPTDATSDETQFLDGKR
ncbi:hypothetical protein BDQ17DRAFT_552738 [Cyathus striatus]|nr:hypothetical protein BDQ17DRAFT_552738 [Cyathus striatus]